MVKITRRGKHPAYLALQFLVEYLFLYKKITVFKCILSYVVMWKPSYNICMMILMKYGIFFCIILDYALQFFLIVLPQFKKKQKTSPLFFDYLQHIHNHILLSLGISIKLNYNSNYWDNYVNYTIDRWWERIKSLRPTTLLSYHPPFCSWYEDH